MLKMVIFTFSEHPNQTEIEDIPSVVDPIVLATDTATDPVPSVDLTPVIAIPATDNGSPLESDIVPELLEALGVVDEEVIEWGPNILEEVAKRFHGILQNGLKKEDKEVLCKKFLFPKNMTLAKSPTLNPEFSSILSEAHKNRDKQISLKQDQIGRALTALGTALSALVKKNPDIASAIRTLNETGKLSHFLETYTRRSLVIPLVERSLIEPLKTRKRDDFLFGEKLEEMVKLSSGIRKTGSLITNLNWKGPPAPRQQQQQRVYRPGGPTLTLQRAQQTNGQYRRRRQPFQPPPPAARRAPLPPPPPPPPRRTTAPQTAAPRRAQPFERYRR